MFLFWQVVRGLLELNNEHAVQIDSHDTLWGETGMFHPSFCITWLHRIITYCFCILDLAAVNACCSERSCISLLHSNALFNIDVAHPKCVYALLLLFQVFSMCCSFWEMHYGFYFKEFGKHSISSEQ